MHGEYLPRYKMNTSMIWIRKERIVTSVAQHFKKKLLTRSSVKEHHVPYFIESKSHANKINFTMFMYLSYEYQHETWEKFHWLACIYNVLDCMMECAYATILLPKVSNMPVFCLTQHTKQGGWIKTKANSIAHVLQWKVKLDFKCRLI